MILAEEWLERRKARMQAEISIEIDGRIGSAALWLRNGDGRPDAIVVWLGKRHDDVQSIRSAALEQHHELLFVGHRRGRDRALQKNRHSAEADHRDAALLQKIAAREFQRPDTFATFMIHFAPPVNPVILMARRISTYRPAWPEL